MSDIKLVIKIPEEEYNYVKTLVKFGITNPLKMRIANGTPLTQNTDAISRAEVLDLIDSKDPNYEVRHFKEDVECLPPISSHESKTVLYSGDGYADGYMVYDIAECPNCGYEYEDGDKDWGLPFCPKCGQSLNWGSEVKE